MKKIIKDLEVYRSDNNKKKNKSYNSVKNNLPKIYNFLKTQGKNLADGKTHTYIKYEET